MVVLFSAGPSRAEPEKHEIHSIESVFQDTKKERTEAVAEISVLNGVLLGNAYVSRAGNSLETEYEHSYEDKDIWNAYFFYKRKLTPFLGVYAGAYIEESEKPEERTYEKGMLAIELAVPMRSTADMRVFHDGSLELEVASELKLASRAGTEGVWTTDLDGEHVYEANLSFALVEKLKLRGTYHSDYGWNAGVTISLETGGGTDGI